MKMPSSGLLRHRDWQKFTDVSEVLAVTIIMAISVLMMEAISRSETSVNFYQITRRCNPEDRHLQSTRYVLRFLFLCKQCLLSGASADLGLKWSCFRVHLLLMSHSHIDQPVACSCDLTHYAFRLPLTTSHSLLTHHSCRLHSGNSISSHQTQRFQHISKRFQVNKF
jgi:hypothetical protein